MNKRISIAVIFVFALNLLVMSPVAGADFYSTIAHPVKIEAPAEITVTVGESVPLTATLYFTDGKTIDAARNGVFTFGNVISFNNGIITGKKVGATTLRIKSYGQTAKVRVTVVKASDTGNTGDTGQTDQPQPPTPNPVRIEAPAEIDVKVGESVPLIATLYFSDSSTLDVSKNAEYSYGNVIDLNNGVITGRSAGDTNLRITSNGLTAIIKVKVTEAEKPAQPPTPGPVRIDVPAEITVTVGESKSLVATLVFSDGSTLDVSEGADEYSFNSNLITFDSGIITGIKPGSTSFMVRSKGITTNFGVNIKEAAQSQEPTLERIEAPAKLTVKIGESVPLTATLYYSDGSTLDLSKNAEYSYGSNIELNNGIITGKNEGATDLVIKYGNKTATIKINVINNSQPVIPDPVRIEAPAELTVKVGESIPLTATLYFTDGKMIDAARNGVYSFGKVINFNNGIITGKKAGATTLRIKSYGQTASVRVTVISDTNNTGQTGQISPVRIEAPAELTVKVGENISLVAALLFSDGSTLDVSKNAEYSYGSNIELNNGIITGKSAGDTILKVTSNAITKNIKISVIEIETPAEPTPEPVKIESPAELTIKVGESIPLTATLSFSDGSTVDAAKNGEYAYGNVIDFNNGVITGKSVGSTDLKITSNGLTANIKINVTEAETPVQPKPEAVRIDAPSDLTVKVGETINLTATLYFSDSSTLDVSKNAEYSYSNAIDLNNGVITGKSAGSTDLIITSYGKTALIKITVTENNQTATPVRLDVPKKITVTVGQSIPLVATVYYSDGSTGDAINGALYLVGDKEIITVTKGIVTGKKVGTSNFKIKSHEIIETVEVEVIEDNQNLSGDQTLDPVLVSGEAVTKDYSWKYNEINFTWEINIPQDLLVYNKEVREAVEKYYIFTSYAAQQAYYQTLPQNIKDMIWAVGPKGNGNETSWAQDSKNLAYTQYLAEKLQEQANKNGWGRYDTANFVLKFVQSLSKGDAGKYPQLAASSLVDVNDCDTKSILYCDIMKNMGYKTALICYNAGVISPTIAHAQAAVVLNDSDIPSGVMAAYRIVNGQNYYEVETMNNAYNVGSSSGYKPTAIYPQ